ncbi:MAG TPA: dihydrofolate reductase family protein [Sphingomicrobium sp.]|nr:dihydrofolate reductase family protein [Sphingomicrobium sp.]
MRKVTYGGAISLDGFLAGPGEAIDWLRWSDDSAKISAESFRGVDAMLMGRKTFEFGQKMGGGPPIKGVTTYVFSRTWDEGDLQSRLLPGQAAPQLVHDEAAEFVRNLKSEPGGGILVMGGGEIGTALLEAGLVDEVGFSVHPVLLGGGTPAFGPMAGRVELNLSEARAIGEDCVLLRYRVAGA